MPALEDGKLHLVFVSKTFLTVTVPYVGLNVHCTKARDSTPLLCNPMLIRVAILLAKGAFRDFETMDELLDFEPGEDGIIQIA
jgi:hypothetical protein